MFAIARHTAAPLASTPFQRGDGRRRMCTGVQDRYRRVHKLPSCPPAWFSERYTLDDLACLNLPLSDNAQRDIGCYELLAQIALVLMLAASVPGGRARICVPSLCDNSSAEATINKLMTTSSPMCFFAQQLALVAFRTAITLDCQHISGFRNESADLLSRIDSVRFLHPLSHFQALARTLGSQSLPRRHSPAMAAPLIRA